MTPAARVWTVAVLLVLAGGVATAQEPELGTEQQRAAGKALYDKYCSQCHGETGDGEGPAAPFLRPKPRDFTTGKYKIRTTTELDGIVYYLKSFSQDFANPEYLQPPIDIPAPPPVTPESIERGREVYEEIGCPRCHGTVGRGDGMSAPTLTDDWGDFIRVADLTQRWTFRGGPTRTDVFRTFSTGLNGTPMPSYFDSLEVEDRWHLVNYIESLGDGDEPDYADLLLVSPVEGDIDLEKADDLFAGAIPARFPLVGQIMEPGRDTYPTTTSLVVDAVYGRKEIALRLRWNDIRADTTGSNDPALRVPLFLDDLPAAAGDDDAGEDAGDFWGEEAGDEGDFRGEEAVDEGGEDFWGEEAADDEEGFWGEDEDQAGVASPSGGSEFSDALAVQLPSVMPTGIRRPYFLFGDPDSSVDIWFMDLAGDAVRQLTGRGSGALAPNDADELEMTAAYDRGQWTVVVKRALRSGDGIGFTEGVFVPVAFSVWDGFNRERGNKRALTQWFHLYLEPREAPSVAGPMIKAALVALVVEILIVVLVRRRYARRPMAATAGGAAPADGPPGEA
jgi:mono/diheme cytochrome c family protein